MKKILAVIPIAILIVLLSSDKIVFADTVLYGQAVWLYGNTSGSPSGEKRWYLCTSQGNNGIVILDKNSSQIYFNGYIYDATVGQLEGNKVSSAYLYYIDSYVLGGAEIVYSGSGQNDLVGFDSVADYEDYINPPKSWWEKLWDTFEDYFTNPIPGSWIKNLIDNVFGDDGNENTISDSVDIANPTLTPAPTPVPYTTVVIPKTDPVTGDTYYETNYYYNNPSGTPIVQPYPPTNAPSTNSPSGSSEYYPVNGDPYSIPVVSWLTSTKIGDTNYDGLDSIGDGMSAVDDIGSEYTDGIGAAQDATSALPSSWLLLIGIAAAIPLLAGIISRFLS